jgi:phage-related protein
VFYYKDSKGNSPIADYIKSLGAKNDKDSRVKLKKLLEYVEYLSREGKQAREPYAKHIDGEIWELRPIRDRVLFAAWDGESFILLHYFMKQTQKTPQREIDKAKRNLADYRERNKDYECKDNEN